jgi:hypothetical protein
MTAIPVEKIRTEARGVHRDEFTSGLRQLADFLDAHPEVPVWVHGAEIHWFPKGECQRAEVDRIAEALGERPEQVLSAYQVKRTFGPIAYVASARDSQTAVTA